jgi:predicted MFS family arabinose efflux permease
MFFFSFVMCIIGNIVGCVAHDYNTLLAARVLAGFATSAYESLLYATVGDLHFVHERGTRISVIAFILAGTSNLY